MNLIKHILGLEYRIKILEDTVKQISTQHVVDTAYQIESNGMQSELLYQISRELNLARSNEAVLRAIVPLCEIGQAVSASLYYIDLNGEQSTWANMVANWQADGATIPPIELGNQHYLPEFPFAKLWESDFEPQFIVGLLADKRLDDTTNETFSALGITSLVLIPLTKDGRWVGLLTVYWDKQHQFSQMELELYRTLPVLVTPVLENLRLIDNLEKLVEIRTTELSETNDKLCQEIADREQAEKALLLAQESTETVNQAKSEFLANVSHELRTPLNGILGYAQILQRDETLTERQRNGVAAIQESGEHLLSLINDVLDLSKVEAGRLKLQTIEFDLSEFLDNISHIANRRIKSPKIEFSLNVSSDLPTGVRADEKRLRQVLITLLDNAVKFTVEGTITLNVECYQGKIRFQVVDTGVGFKPADLEYLFQPFRQFGDQPHGATETGLGLSISKQLVDMMGGTLQVESAPGQGSNFWFDLELQIVERLSSVNKLSSLKQVMGYQGERRKLLVVDDKEENRSVLRKLLKRIGFVISEATNGQEAIDQAKTIKPDLILMDITMPILDGLEATRQMRQIPELKDVIVIALSGRTFEEDMEACREAGCDDFVAKPLDFKSMLGVLQSHLKLNWIYDPGLNLNFDSTPSQVDSSEPVQVGPPNTMLETLLELAKRGDVKRIRHQVTQLEASDEIYGPFAEQIRQLAKRYRVKQIRELLQSYVR
jgi:signal transduction histidine kinase/DNA-binding NarL/FixJ family response regulator